MRKLLGGVGDQCLDSVITCSLEHYLLFISRLIQLKLSAEWGCSFQNGTPSMMHGLWLSSRVLSVLAGLSIRCDGLGSDRYVNDANH